MRTTGSPAGPVEGALRMREILFPTRAEWRGKFKKRFQGPGELSYCLSQLTAHFILVSFQQNRWEWVRVSCTVRIFADVSGSNSKSRCEVTAEGEGQVVTELEGQVWGSDISSHSVAPLLLSFIMFWFSSRNKYVHILMYNLSGNIQRIFMIMQFWTPVY